MGQALLPKTRKIQIPNSNLKHGGYSNPNAYLEGQEDLVTRLIMGINGLTIWVIGVITLLTKSPDPPSTTIGPGGILISGLDECL